MIMFSYISDDTVKFEGEKSTGGMIKLRLIIMIIN